VPEVEREDLAGHDPMAVLARWAAEAVAATWQPTMTFATADASGTPHARTVLVTAIDAASLRFHSSRPTTKTLDIAVQPRASGVFFWPGRQVVLHGMASELPVDVSRAAFPSRPLGLRRLAWAYDALGAEGSDTVLAHGDVEQAFAAAGAAMEMPPSWTTIRLVPDRADFWQAGDDDTPAVKTRFIRNGPAWTSHPALP
jgi:pyridoxamine 5'-phosphate oxidase